MEGLVGKGGREEGDGGERMENGKGLGKGGREGGDERGYVSGDREGVLGAWICVDTCQWHLFCC